MAECIFLITGVLAVITSISLLIDTIRAVTLQQTLVASTLLILSSIGAAMCLAVYIQLITK